MRRLLCALSFAALALTSTACVSKPTMKLNHADISGVRVSFPPSVGVLMTVVIDVYNPNSYDVAVRAVRGQVLMGNRYSMPVDFKANGDGVWLPSGRTTSIGVPVDVPVNIGLAVVKEAYMSPSIPYRFSGRADVTATRTFKLERDDYAVDETGFISRQQVEQALPFGM